MKVLILLALVAVASAGYLNAGIAPAYTGAVVAGPAIAAAPAYGVGVIGAAPVLAARPAVAAVGYGAYGHAGKYIL